MNINVLGLQISTTTEIFAAVVAGIVVLVIIFIILCCYCLCTRGRFREKRKTTINTLPAENPPTANRGNYQHDEQAQQRHQQNNNLPRVAEQQMNHKNRFPPPAASPLQHPPTHQPAQSSMESTGSNSLPPPQQSRRSPTPQFPSAYPRSGKSDASGSEISSVPPASPAFSLASPQTMFTYKDLAMATNSFSQDNFLGEGGFGLVHKGVLPNRKDIAVKSLRANGGQGEREFEAEIEIINRVHHRHLVSLVGYCSTGSHRLLVYEFIPNKTLEFHLHGKGQPTMDWATRMKVAVGAAKGLAYLHEDCQPRIIHRDIKAANILLDNKFQAKVADFGLAKIAPEEDTHVSTRIMGTLGYLAPEYATSGRLTDKSDVYSFGVLLLEMITGRRPIDSTQKVYNLVEWARPLLTTAIEDENLNTLVDPRLQFSYKHSEMARMVSCAGLCVRKSARSRPLMSQVVRALEGNLSIKDLCEGITPGRSFVQRYDDTASEQSDSDYKTGSTGYSEDLYKVNSTGFDSKNTAPSTREYGITSEYGGSTSEYGMYVSSSSSEEQTAGELNSKRSRRHFK